MRVLEATPLCKVTRIARRGRHRGLAYIQHLMSPPISVKMPLLMAVFLACSVGEEAAAAPSGTLDRKALLADLKVLSDELPAKHAKPFHRIPRRVFLSEVTALRARIANGIGPDEVFVGMSRIVNSIGDGHTGMPNPIGAPLYGLRFARFGEEYRLIGTVAGAGADAALGSRLTSVGGVPVAEVEGRLLKLTPADETLALRQGRVAALLDRGVVLHGLGLAKDRVSAQFSLVTDDGLRVTVEARPEIEDGARWLSAARGVPMSARNSESSLSCEKADARSLYCNFRSYKDLSLAAAGMFETIARERPTRLIIDLRQNGGGNFCDGLKYLVEPLAARNDLNRAGHLYVLIGPETFSAAMSNSAHFRQLTQALLVGEPIGEIPNSYQEVSTFTLPNSGWVVRYSTRFYRFAPGGENLIRPDKPIARTWVDYAGGKDAALDWILSQPNDGSASGSPPRAVAVSPAGGYMCSSMH